MVVTTLGIAVAVSATVKRRRWPIMLVLAVISIAVFMWLSAEPPREAGVCFPTFPMICR